VAALSDGLRIAAAARCRTRLPLPGGQVGKRACAGLPTAPQGAFAKPRRGTLARPQRAAAGCAELARLPVSKADMAWMP
jgi:hypothetical protein